MIRCVAFVSDYLLLRIQKRTKGNSDLLRKRDTKSLHDQTKPECLLASSSSKRRVLIPCAAKRQDTGSPWWWSLCKGEKRKGACVSSIKPAGEVELER